MWKLKIAEGRDEPWLTSVNNHLGREHWEFDPEAGTTDERAHIDKLRAEFRNNRFCIKQSANMIMKLQLTKENPSEMSNLPPQVKLQESEDVTKETVTTTLRRAISFYSTMQAHDGHWPAESAGPLFTLPPLVIISYIVGGELSSIVSPHHEKEFIRYIYNHQNEDGGWGLHIEGHSTMLGSSLNYISLRLLGEGLDDGEDKAMEKGRRWILDHGGLVAIPFWGKFWAAILGLYEWEGCNPIPPEIWLLPKFLPIHPGQLCYCPRVVSLPMSYLYGKRFVGPLTSLIRSLREELYNQPYEEMDWNKARNMCAKEDLYYPHPMLQDLFWSSFQKVGEPILRRWPFSKLRDKALETAMKHIHYEDEQSGYLCIGSYGKLLSMLACWVEDPRSDSYKRHLPRILDNFWVAEDGLKLQIIGQDCVCYFHDMIVEMLRWGFQEGKTLFGFGYDFRQSNRLQETMDQFAAKLESVYTASGGKKLNIISHSMGGLLVKCFMCLYSDTFEKYVKNWIAIAAPFRGAPGYITTSLLNGMSFLEGWEQNLFISRWSMQQLLIECPSIYELMACPTFDWAITPLLEIWREKQDGNGSSVMLESYGPAEVMPIFKEALSNNKVDYRGVNMILPFNLEILKWARETQEILSQAKVPPGVKFYNIYGTNYDTPHSVCYGSENTPITDLQQILPLKGKYVCVDGDGTVPMESAKADGLNAEARVGVPGEHRGIICDHHVFRILKHWLKAGDLDPFYNPLNDYVILPTAFDIEKELDEGLQITSLKEEWQVIPEEDKDSKQGTLSENPVVTSISVSNMGKEQTSQAEAHVTANIVVQPQAEGSKHVQLTADISVSKRE